MTTQKCKAKGCTGLVRLDRSPSGFCWQHADMAKQQVTFLYSSVTEEGVLLELNSAVTYLGQRIKTRDYSGARSYVKLIDSGLQFLISKGETNEG